MYYGNTYKKISWRHSLNHLVEDGLRVASSLYNTIDYGLLQALNKNITIRRYHTTSKLNNNDSVEQDFVGSPLLNNDITKELYNNRIAPVKAFSDKILLSCHNILDLEKRAEFFNNLKEIPKYDKGGIYLFQYNDDPLVYYIGRTSTFSARFKSHIKHKTTDKFHVFANLVGWNNFTVSIIEICDRCEQGKRENFYLQKYLPLLNSTFNSNFSETSIYDTLKSVLKSKQEAFTKEKLTDIRLNSYPTLSIEVLVYNYNEISIDQNYKKCASISEACKLTGIARQTISAYLDTNVPIKGLLLFSKTIKDFNLVLSLVEESKKTLPLNNLESKPVWVYCIDNDKVLLVNNEPFKSRELTAKFLNTSHNIVRYYMDSWEGRGYRGYYLFSRFLTDKEINSLRKIWTLGPSTHKTQVWAYEAKSLKLINNSSFVSMQKCAEFFNVDYRSISNNLDTKLAIDKNGHFIYLFSKELDKTTLQELSLNPQIAKNMVSSVWVYTKSNNNYILLDNRQPFKSKLQASKELGISTKTITKYENTNSSYKDLYFFNTKQ